MIGGGTAGEDSDAPSVEGTGAVPVVTVRGDAASIGGLASLNACCAGGSTGAGTSDGLAFFAPELASPSFVCVLGSTVCFAASRDGSVMAAGAWSSEGVAWSAAADGGGGGGEEDMDLVWHSSNATSVNNLSAYDTGRAARRTFRSGLVLSCEGRWGKQERSPSMPLSLQPRARTRAPNSQMQSRRIPTSLRGQQNTSIQPSKDYSRKPIIGSTSLKNSNVVASGQLKLKMSSDRPANASPGPKIGVKFSWRATGGLSVRLDWGRLARDLARRKRIRSAWRPAMEVL